MFLLLSLFALFTNLVFILIFYGTSLIIGYFALIMWHYGIIEACFSSFLLSVLFTNSIILFSILLNKSQYWMLCAKNETLVLPKYVSDTIEECLFCLWSRFFIEKHTSFVSYSFIGGGQPHEPRCYASRKREASGSGAGLSGSPQAQAWRSHDAEQSAKTPDPSGQKYQKKGQQEVANFCLLVFVTFSCVKWYNQCSQIVRFFTLWAESGNSVFDVGILCESMLSVWIGVFGEYFNLFWAVIDRLELSVSVKERC